MSAALTALTRSLTRRPPTTWPELGRAVRALQALLESPDETQHAFEVGYALDGDPFQRDLQNMLRYETGRKLLRERPSLLEALSDDDTLHALPEGSLGRAYLDHLERYALSAEKLVHLRRTTDPAHSLRDETERWWVERVDLMHDLWHVLSGYGADGAGEGALLLFTLAQRPTRSGALLSLGASLKLLRIVGPSWILEVWHAWRSGRRASALSALPYEHLLAEPLADVRRAVGLEPAPPALRSAVGI